MLKGLVGVRCSGLYSLFRGIKKQLEAEPSANGCFACAWVMICMGKGYGRKPEHHRVGDDVQVR